MKQDLTKIAIVDATFNDDTTITLKDGTILTRDELTKVITEIYYGQSEPTEEELAAVKRLKL